MIARLIAFFFVGVLYALGPVLLLVAIGTSIPTAEFVHASLSADGTIVDLNRVYVARQSKEVYLPIFRFTANDGQSHMIMADSNINWVQFRRGDHIRVLYLKDRPESARINSVPQLWMAQLMLAFFGIIFTLLTVRMLRRHRSRVVVNV